MPPVPFVFLREFEQFGVKLFEMIFVERNVPPRLENHVHHAGIPRNLLFVAGSERCGGQAGEKLSNLMIRELGPLNAR